MKDLRLDDIQLALVNPHSNIRNALRMALNDAGVRSANIIDGAELDVISEALQGTFGVDIIICDTNVRGGDVLQILHAIRQNDVGPNPFLGMIAMGADSTLEAVKQVMVTGADFYIASPVSPQQILDRLSSMVHGRKPFVVTADYVGPDRRGIPRPDNEYELIEPPNTIRAKALGEWNEQTMKEELGNAVGQLNDHKMARHAYRLAYNAERVALDHGRTHQPPDQAHLHLLIASAADLKKRSALAGLIHVGQLCGAVQTIVEKIRDPNHLESRDFELLMQIAFAIRAAVNPAERSAALALDIAEVVQTAQGG